MTDRTVLTRYFLQSPQLEVVVGLTVMHLAPAMQGVLAAGVLMVRLVALELQIKDMLVEQGLEVLAQMMPVQAVAVRVELVLATQLARMLAVLVEMVLLQASQVRL
jgi:redox-regulated HSP33 family molecular chaperone